MTDARDLIAHTIADYQPAEDPVRIADDLIATLAAAGLSITATPDTEVARLQGEVERLSHILESWDEDHIARQPILDFCDRWMNGYVDVRELRALAELKVAPDVQ